MALDEFREPPSLDGAWYRLRDYHRRLRLVEGELDKYAPAVQDEKLKTLIMKVDTLQRSVYGLMFVIVGGSVTFAFTVFALLGHHP